MKNYYCLIVEDSPQAIDTLKNYLTRLPFFMPPQVCSTVGEAILQLNQRSYDLILLDMKLPDQSGLELLRSFPSPMPVVVTTAYDEFAVECYDLNIADYLLKPFSIQRFMRSINRALNVQFSLSHFAEQEGIFLKTGRNVQRFSYNSIHYVEALGSYCKIHTNGKVEVVNETISNLQASLPRQWFIRVHKSYIINVDKLTSYSHRFVMISGMQIPIGAIYRDRFQGFLALLTRPGESE
ncbi:LytR/AlgR family response regulator transcription factor [Spirosoma areae]